MGEIDGARRYPLGPTDEWSDRDSSVKMASYSTSDFRKGLKVQIDGEPYLMVEMEFMKPGKGSAVYKAKLRNLLTGRILDRNYRSGDSLEAADITEYEAQYLYQDGTNYHFMNPETFDQFELSKEQLGDAAQWMVEEMTVSILSWDGRPISVTPPAHVDLRVTYTEPGAKGNSTGNVQKPATVHTGAEIMVPTFINQDDIVRIDTRTGEYVERVTKS